MNWTFVSLVIVFPQKTKLRRFLEPTKKNLLVKVCWSCGEAAGRGREWGREGKGWGKEGNEKRSEGMEEHNRTRSKYKNWIL